MVTLRDVARVAGVSHVTVSRAFNNASLVHEDTRARILAAAQELGYRPNTVARSMVTGRTMTIGLISSQFFWTPMIAEIERAAAGNGYSVIYALADSASGGEAVRIERLLEQRVDGIVSVCSSAVTDHSPLRKLHAEGVPVVTLNRYADDVPCSKVFFDNVGGQAEAVQHLIELGHERIGFVGGGPDHRQRCVRDQIDGYRAVLHEAGLSADGLQWFGGDGVDDGEQLGLACLRAETPPTAVVTVNDQVAAGVLRAAYALGLRVPQDLSVVGWGDTIVAESTCPPLTSVGFPYAQASQAALRLLFDQIAHDSEVTSTVVVRRVLAKRKSCCPPGARAATAFRPAD